MVTISCEHWITSPSGCAPRSSRRRTACRTASDEFVEVPTEVKDPTSDLHRSWPFSLIRPHRQGLGLMPEILSRILPIHAAIRQHPHTNFVVSIGITHSQALVLRTSRFVTKIHN